MRDLTKRFISEQERTDISNLVKQIENKTSGELVPMIVSTSGNYGEYNIIGALAFSLPLSVCAAYLINWYQYGTGDTLMLFLMMFLPQLILFFLILNYMPCLKRIFIPKHVIEEEVRESAAYSFFTNGLHKTKEASGVLLYISVFERRVWIMADSGINSKLPEGTWDGIVADLIKGLKQKKNGEVIVTAINRIGELLISNFPANGDSTNELPDLIVGK
ncbi:MAG TPA: TPM domain-containing protein [bacterium]|nr:TPM domain-containing protein [bacterium]HQN73643.1 TPM domain-containing protein [bacterium]HQO92063.1 TPM domain-containing protein [bacterium]